MVVMEEVAMEVVTVEAMEVVTVVVVMGEAVTEVSKLGEHLKW